MSSPTPKVDRQTTTPFLLKLFYRTGSFHRLDEFSPRTAPPPHLQIYTWPSCSLRELTHLLTGALPSLLPDPAIGTRLAFRLVFPDTREPSRPGPARFLSKDLGSVVVGAGGPGIPDGGDGDPDTRNGDDAGAADVDAEDKGAAAHGNGVSSGAPALAGDPDRTLQDARFLIGDFVSVAVVPPLPDGSVAAPPPSTPMSATSGGGPPPPGAGGPGGFRGGRPEYGMGRGGPPPRENGFGGGFGPRRGGGPRNEGGPRGIGVPSGEWRRGERLPDSYGGQGGGYGRGRGRPRPY